MLLYLRHTANDRRRETLWISPETKSECIRFVHSRGNLGELLGRDAFDRG
jgi:hypothetical protein